ncbi:hypothetical protein ACFLWV_02275 [Chloroflexota bacterium]
MNNIIIFATYWNEIDWVKPSLEQIDRINPVEIVICDGCFDPVQPNYSTDGTREIIEKFVAERDNARMVSALRRSKIESIISLLKGNSKSKSCNMLKPSRWLTALTSARKNVYRLNQAITFNYMISLSRFWEPGRWFMAYDADQFYSDEMINEFSVTNEDSDYGLLTGKELTFFEDFTTYTGEYEKREYNNMPHRIYSNTMIKPTRDQILETFFARKKYVEAVRSKETGLYFHYKFNSPRFQKGYELGDRKKPDISRYAHKEFKGEHPAVIRKYFMD